MRRLEGPRGAPRAAEGECLARTPARATRGLPSDATTAAASHIPAATTYTTQALPFTPISSRCPLARQASTRERSSERRIEHRHHPAGELLQDGLLVVDVAATDRVIHDRGRGASDGKASPWTISRSCATCANAEQPTGSRTAQEASTITGFQSPKPEQNRVSRGWGAGRTRRQRSCRSGSNEPVQTREGIGVEAKLGQRAETAWSSPTTKPRRRELTGTVVSRSGASPRFVHTVRSTPLGPQDASTFSRLARGGAPPESWAKPTWAGLRASPLSSTKAKGTRTAEKSKPGYI